MDAAHLLWEDAAPYQRRFERSAAALVAVARAVREDRQDAAGEFLALYDAATRADPVHFTRVWRDPAAYQWVRRAVEILATRAPAEALEVHLGEFARFALGLGLAAGERLVFAKPYETALPLAIPGSELVVAGAGRVRISGLVDGGIEILEGGSRVRVPADGTGPSDGVHLERCPVVTVEEARVVLNPHVFQLSGQTLDFQRRHATLVAEALRALRRFHPAAFSELASVVQIVALKPVREDDFGTLSSSELPGAFVCSVPSDAFALAADFIHELHHYRLFSIEETGPFFEPGSEDPIEAELHYSPWRDAPRPLHGLLHAVYVYLPVFRFWRATSAEGGVDGARRAYARDQLARIPFQLRIGLNQLRRHARFTPLGSALFDVMVREAARIERDAGEIGATLATPAVTCRANGALRPVVDRQSGRPRTVGETLLDHLERCGRREECAEERRLLAPG